MSVVGAVCNTDSFAHTAWGVNVCDGGKRDPDDLLGCPQYLLQVLAI